MQVQFQPMIQSTMQTIETAPSAMQQLSQIEATQFTVPNQNPNMRPNMIDQSQPPPSPQHQSKHNGMHPYNTVQTQMLPPPLSQQQQMMQMPPPLVCSRFRWFYEISTL